MYANIEVTAGRKTLAAHHVEILNGVVRVHLDANDGDGNYAEPNGTIDLDPAADGPISLRADF